MVVVGFLSRIRLHFDRWRLCTLFFAIIYGCILSIDLSSGTMRWDEVSHFTGSLLLSRGQFGLWVSNNAFYPPAFDLIAAAYYLIGGASVFAARLVAVTFSILSLVVVYELASRLYNGKTAFLSAIFLAVMPGIVWVSRMAMIETTLLFIFSLSILFLFNWIKTNDQRDLVMLIISVAVGGLVKYQMIVVIPIILLLGALFWKRDYIKNEAKRHLELFVLVAVLAIALTIIAAFVLLKTDILSTWGYVLQVGGASKSFYSSRYPLPVFYFLEMAWLNNTMHPISLLLYVSGLAGLGLFALKRRFEEKFLLLIFAVVFVVFTLIPNREWRYVSIVFPVLAIAAGNLFVQAFSRLQRMSQTENGGLGRKWKQKIPAVLLITVVATGVVYSCFESYMWLSEDQLSLPIKQATLYANQGLGAKQKILVACPVNRFNQNMIWYYLNYKAPAGNQNQTLQYPEQAVDSFTPNVKTTELIKMCQQHNVKYVFLFEYGGTTLYFNSTLSERDVYSLLVESGEFALQTSYGAEPNRIFILSFGQ